MKTPFVSQMYGHASFFIHPSLGGDFWKQFAAI